MNARYLIPVLGLLAGVGCHGNGSDTPDGVVDDDTDGSDGGSTDDDGSTDELSSFVVESPVHAPVQGAWPAAAFDGNSYLAVWEDHRLRRSILYAGRVTADGIALDPFGFRILDVLPEALGVNASEPDVAFDGENFLVVTRAGERIVGVRVSPAGEVLDPDGLLIADSVAASRPSLVFDGQQWLVVWAQTEPGSEGIYQARVESSGTVLDPGGVFVYESHASQNGYLPPWVNVSFDGSNALLSWVTYEGPNFQELRGLHASRTAVDGTPIDETPVRLSFEGENVIVHAAGFDGTNHVIAWASSQAGIRASRVAPDGTILDPDGFTVHDGSEYPGYYGDYVNRMDMASGNGRSVVVWSRFDVDSGVDDPDPVRVATVLTDGTASLHPDDAFPSASEATIAAHPQGALLLWSGGPHPFLDHNPIVGTRLDAIGMPVGDAVAPASPASRQEVLAVASDGQQFFVLWTDTREPSGAALHGARVEADGTPLESIQLTTDLVLFAHVVFDGANFVVSWADPPSYGSGDGSCSSFNSVRISPAGERLDVEPVKIPLLNDLAGASDGTRTLLVGGPCEGSDSMALLLDQGLATVSEPVPIEQPAYQLAAAFDGFGYLVVWRSPQVFGRRITQAGALEGQPFMIADTVAHQVSVAAGSGNQLVVWDTDGEIRATRVSANAQVLDPEGLLVAALDNGPCGGGNWHSCSESSVVFDGESFVVAWRERSNPGQVNSVDLYAATVSPEGQVSPRFVLSPEPEREGAAFLATNDEGQVLAAFSRFVPGPPYDTRRAVATLLP